MMPKTLRLALGLALALSQTLAADELPKTPAELADFNATPTHAETLEYLEMLAGASPWIELTGFGTSPEGRSMPLVIVSSDGHFTPEAARASGKPIVLVQNGIHSGEIDGKDASLMLLREVASGGMRETFEHLILLVIPIYNVDGHERISPYNRANQDGPVEGMGFRTTTAGYDLNRDHLKVESMEARALIGLFNTWRPHLHVDNHVTNGSDHGWIFTWSWAEAPQIHPKIDEWFKAHMPFVMALTRQSGYPTGPYVGLIDRNDPSKGMNSWVGQPRYSGGYFPLRQRPSILVEMHAYKPYRDRVLALRAFLGHLLDRVSGSGAALVHAVERAEDHTVALGRPDAEPSEVVVEWAAHDTGDTVVWPAYAWTHEESQAMGVPILVFERGVPAAKGEKGLEVPWIHASKAAKTATRPRGYVVLPGWPQIEERLAIHGLRTVRVGEATAVDGETVRVDVAEHSATPYQGRHRASGISVERRAGTVTVPPGSLWIPADQPDFEVAVQLLEPDAPDSLVAWGLVSTIFERKEYIDSRMLEELVVDMLKEPAMKAKWEAALEADDDLSGNPWARWLWWYRQTPYWDDRVGMMPVVRVAAVPEGW